MTDPRFGDDLLAAVRRLPAGSGVIFRHYQLDATKRLKLFRQVKRISRQRGHVILLAGDEGLAMRWRADGVHGSLRRRANILHSTAVHNRKELARAKLTKADMVLISPIFKTKSHPGQRPLGIAAFSWLAAKAGKAKVIALGGLTHQRAHMLNRAIVHGWAAIDALGQTRFRSGF